MSCCERQHPFKTIRRWLYEIRVRLLTNRRVPVMIKRVVDDLHHVEIEVKEFGKITGCGFSLEEALLHLSHTVERRLYNHVVPIWCRLAHTTKEMLLVQGPLEGFFFTPSRTHCDPNYIRKTDGRRFKESKRIKPKKHYEYFLIPVDGQGADIDEPIHTIED